MFRNGNRALRITDREAIAETLGALAGDRAPVQVELGRERLEGSLQADADGLLVLFGPRHPPAQARGFPGGRARLGVSGALHVYAFEAELSASLGGAVRLRMPSVLLRVSGRSELRTGSVFGLSVSFRHPRDPRLWVHREVHEVSRRGICFSTDAFRDGVAPGVPLSDVMLTWDEGSVQVSATVRHVVTGPGPGGDERCGLQVQVQPGDADRWNRAVSRWLFPNTRFGQTWAEASWNLYDRSGYFRLSKKEPANFAHLRRAFAIASRRLDLAPEVGCQVTWPSERGVEATLSLLRLYTGTSLVYQVARRRDEESPAGARAMLREINLHAFSQLSTDPTQKWVLVFVQDDGARWSRHAYRDYALRLGRSDRSCVTHFHALESTTRARGPASPPLASRIAPAGERATRRLSEYIHATRPRAFREALDLTPERLSLASLQRLWRERGFERSRKILIAASRDGTPVAAAVVETAQEGLHLFGLLDSVRLFALRPDGVAHYEALLEASRAWFLERGKEHFVVLAEDDQQPLLSKRGPRNLGGASLIAISTELLPDFIEHLHLITAGRRPQEREVRHV